VGVGLSIFVQRKGRNREKREHYHDQSSKEGGIETADLLGKGLGKGFRNLGPRNKTTLAVGID